MNYFLKTIAVGFFITASLQLIAQDNNPRREFRNGISVYAVGPNVVGSVSYDYFISPILNLEAGIGFIGVHGGFRLHLSGNRGEKRWTPYIGASIARSLYRSVGTDYVPYFPIGMHYIGKDQFNFAVEIAPLQLSFLSWNVIGAKAGYRF